jgi:hypothetical protein
MNRIRYITTEFKNEFPVVFKQATGEKFVRVVACRVYNTYGQEDIAITLHADFADEEYNKYDGFITFCNHYFREHDFIIQGARQFFNISFKVLSDEEFNFEGWKFVLELEMHYEQK